MTPSRWMTITLILLLGALTRGWHIAEQSFWVDEGYAFYHAQAPDLALSLARDTHPPLYFAALRLWSELAGHSELALRWFSLLPSMLSLGLIYQAARELTRERPTARGSAPTLALLMLALADAENFLAQEARHYTWLLLLTLASILFFLRWLRCGGRRENIAWIVCGITMLHTHYITAFAAAAQGVYALVWLRGAKRGRAVLALSIAGLSLLPWLLLVGGQQLGNRGANWSVELSGPVLQDILIRYFSGQWTFVIGLALLGCCSVIYAPGARYRLRWHRESALLLLWLLLPFALTVAVNEFLPFLQPRRLNQATPAIALLTALGLANIRPPIRGLLVAALIVYGLAQVDFYRVKPDWRAVAQLTARFAGPGDLVLTDIAGGDYQLGYYLRRQVGSAPPLSSGFSYESLKIRRDFYPDEYEAWLPALLEGQSTVWLTYWSGDQSAFAWLERLGFVRSADFVHRHEGGASRVSEIHVFRYDAPGRLKLISRFENGMMLQYASFDAADLQVDTLWTTSRPLERDYIISAKLLDASGTVAAQHDGTPQLGNRPTSGWEMPETIWSRHVLAPLKPLRPGDYRLAIQVYYHAGDALVNVRGEGREEYVVVDSFRLETEA